MILNEVGLECEYFLLDSEGNILEAPKYNFPADEIGFLIEVTSLWGDDPHAIIDSLENAKNFCIGKAHDLGFFVEEIPYKYVTPEWMKFIREKNAEAMAADHTRNIYPNPPATAHTGCREDEEGLFVTSGLHVHFSRFDTIAETHLSWDYDDVEYIVYEMDNAFSTWLSSGKRIGGEWEPKGLNDDTKRPHGFEYRGLPCDAPKLEVAIKALELLSKLV